MNDKKQETYGFALGGTAGILWQLKQIDCCYSVFSNNIDHYLFMILHDQPPYILGLGSYSGIDQDKIRIETKCSNQFRNDFENGNTYQEVQINLFLTPSSVAKLAYGIGNSYCNKVSWEIMKLINEKKLRSQYTFLHIPKTIKHWIVRKDIDRMLLDFKNNSKH